MGEKQNRSFQFCFNGFLKVDFQGGLNGGAIMDHRAPRERRFVAVEK